MIEKLGIYKDAYLLTNKIYNAMPQMDKMHRFTIGTRILNSSLDMFKWITLANNTRDKIERLKYLDSFLSDFEMLRVYLRICTDNKILKLNTLRLKVKVDNETYRKCLGDEKSFNDDCKLRLIEFLKKYNE